MSKISGTSVMPTCISANEATSDVGVFAISVYTRTGKVDSPGGAMSIVAPSSPKQKMKDTTHVAMRLVRNWGKIMPPKVRVQLAPAISAACSLDVEI